MKSSLVLSTFVNSAEEEIMSLEFLDTKTPCPRQWVGGRGSVFQVQLGRVVEVVECIATLVLKLQHLQHTQYLLCGGNRSSVHVLQA